jgi:RNA polymerase sigma-70 factor (ECF subfamily)
MSRVATDVSKSSNWTPEHDLNLLAAVLDGDTRAWDNFCRRYESLIISCVRRVLHRYGVSYNAVDLADFVAEVWVVLLHDDRRKLRQYDSTRGYRLSSWIGLIASNCTIDQLRAKTAEHSSLEDIRVPERLLVDNTSPHARLEQVEAAELARAAFARLNEDDRDFVVACFQEERSPAVLAEELGVSVNTIYSRKFKVRAKLVRIASSIENCIAA